MARQEKAVEEHQAYQETCARFNTWLRVAREKLATCADTFGDKATVQDKYDRAEALSRNLSDGKELLAKVSKI